MTVGDCHGAFGASQRQFETYRAIATLAAANSGRSSRSQ